MLANLKPEQTKSCPEPLRKSETRMKVRSNIYAGIGWRTPRNWAQYADVGRSIPRMSCLEPSLANTMPQRFDAVGEAVGRNGTGPGMCGRANSHVRGLAIDGVREKVRKKIEGMSTIACSNQEVGSGFWIVGR